MSLPAVVAIVAGALTLIFAFAAFANLLDGRQFGPKSSPDELRYAAFLMAQACAELLMAFFIAAAGVALSGVLPK